MKEYARKLNRQIEITSEQQKTALLSEGYNILDETGRIIERNRNSKISISEYQSLKAENESLKAELAALKAENESLKAAAPEKAEDKKAKGGA